MTGNLQIFEEAMNKGHAAAWDQQWPRAIACYRTALQEVPADPLALNSLGFALLQSGKAEEALNVYQRAAAASPGDPVAPEKCGEILEQLNRAEDAIRTYLAVAEIHLKRRDVDKAIDNWGRVVRLAPNHLMAHSRLALALERTGKNHQAALEYLEVARVFQRNNEAEKALQSAARAQQLEPQSQQIREALDKLRHGLPLPSQVGTGALHARSATGMLSHDEAQAFTATPARPVTKPLSPEKLNPLEAAPAVESAGSGSLSPLAAAKEQALAQLAEILFEQDADTTKTSSSLRDLTRRGGLARDAETRRAQAIMYLGQAINFQTNRDTEGAVSNYTSAFQAGLDNPLIPFMIGALNTELKRFDEAVRYFPPAMQRKDIGLGALFGQGAALAQLGRAAEAFPFVLEAVKWVDLQLTQSASRQQDRLSEAYESLAETLSRSSTEQKAQFALSLIDFLSGEGWEERAQQARRNLDASAEEGQVVTLVEMLANPGSDRLLQIMQQIMRYINQRHLLTAMEEAYYALHFAPTYLPAHIRIAEILVAEDRREAAITKYTVTAEAYETRGEVGRASRLIQEVLKLNPIDTTGRTKLIRLLIDQGQTEEALSHYLELADTYYQLADLETARATYTNALAFAEKSGVDRAWRVRLLHHIADMDLQRLAWKEALRSYEQINKLSSYDEKARQMVVELSFRLGIPKQALAELDVFLQPLLAAKNFDKAVSLLEDLVEAYPDEMGLCARLAKLYQDQGRKADALAKYQRLAELQVEVRQTARAIETVRTMLALNPDDPSEYQRLLEQLQSGGAPG